VRTADQAVRAAERIGYPVVVKPLDGNHGRGVCLDLQDEADVRAAFPIAEEQSRRGVIVVESLIIGKDYRCLVIDGRIAAIAERVPASVTGDGVATIEQLVDTANADPRRGVGHEKVLTRIKVDDAAIGLVREQGFAMTTYRPRGRWGSWRHWQHPWRIPSTGPLEAQPENIEIAEEVARMVGLI
jgi:cyanophycin synthetase